MKKHSFLLFALFCVSTSYAQKREYAVTVSKTDSVIRIDGELTESVWHRAVVATNFILNFPNDTALARNQTEVRLTFDNQNLYVAVVCFDQDRGRRFVASSLRRDFQWDENDNFTLYLDPFGDGQNGFTFNTTPLGVEREGLIFNGERVATEWDNKWRSGVKVYADRWVAEMVIPFKTIRYKGNTQQFKMNFARHDLKNNQRSSWSPVPIAYRISSLAYTGTVHFDEPLPHPGMNVSVIPYVTAGASNRFVSESDDGTIMPLRTPNRWTENAGFDAKVAVTPSLNLDLTVNPDFSQVEVDQQVTNLSRFELFFPERRQFFLENADLFDSFGSERNRPFFSRRVGIGRDTLTGQIVQNPILYGARLSGKLDKNWRIGLMNMQTARNARRGIAAQNYTVAAVQRQVSARSNVAGIFINRDRFGGLPGERFTRMAGLEYNLLSADNKWTGKAFFHQAFQPGNAAGSYTHGTRLQYQDRNWGFQWLHEYVGRNYNINDIGYVERNAYWQFNPGVNYTWYPENSRTLVSHGPGAELQMYLGLNGRTLDRNLDIFYNWQFQNTSFLSVGTYQYYTYLFQGFDPTNSGGRELPANTGYQQPGFFWEYGSDARKLFNWSTEGFTGRYFNGTIVNAVGQFNYRFQPYGAVSLNVEFNRIRLPENYNDANFWLVGPRVDVSFSRSLF
nr:carbohydrate binding family 9 domain-containing protein [Cytophagales bacterium]